MPRFAGYKAPTHVLNTGVPSSLTVTVPTKTNALVFPTRTRRTWPQSPTPAPEIISALASVVALTILLLVFYRAAGRPLSPGANLHYQKIIYALSILALFIPPIFA